MSDSKSSKKELSEELQIALKTITEHFDTEERSVRERQLRLWKKLKYYWNGFQRLWWSEIAHDWRVFDAGNLRNDNSDNSDSMYYDKPINVFRPYLETIIAALSISVPSIKCYPDDADNDLDLTTAKGGDKIADLVYKHNDAPLLWIHALFIYCTEGMIAAYSYPKSDEKYGSYPVPDYEQTEEENEVKTCPNCGNQLNDSDLNLQALEEDEFQPDDSDSLGDVNPEVKESYCANCMKQVDPEITKEKFIVTRLSGVTNQAKTRQCIQVFGGLNVQVPNYARNQESCPYIKLSYEDHWTLLAAKYEDALKDKNSNSFKIDGGEADPYEKWARLSPQYYGEYPLNVATERQYWLRPSSYLLVSDEDTRRKLAAKFPDGCHVTFVNETYCHAENAQLDDYWTLAYNPLSDYVQYDPLGLLLTSIQEITTDLISLVLQTIEHGIGQTFADPEVLNFPKYKQTEAAPGLIFPAKPKSGKSIGDSFFELRTANLSQEVEPFSNKLQELAQFTSGALPSLSGGAQPNSSKTAAQYAMSRAQSLQRLQPTWKSLTFWWKNIFAKVIPSYIKTMADDERVVKQDEFGNFINLVIRKAQMRGKIGSVELEASEQLPETWAQKKQVIMDLMQSSNPQILQALISPENAPLLASAIGLDDFAIPGEDDRDKQYEEITQLLASEPIPSPGPNGQMTQKPSVEVEPLVDNHHIEADICRRWLVGASGRQAKVDNPNGYKNVLLHMQDHMRATALIGQVTSGNGAPPSNGQPPIGNAPSAKPTQQAVPSGNDSVQ